MFYVYILFSQRDKKFYVGQTEDLQQRVRRHNEGRVASTKGRAPLDLVWSESYSSRSEAVRRERYLKSLKGNARFKDIIGL